MHKSCSDLVPNKHPSMTFRRVVYDVRKSLLRGKGMAVFDLVVVELVAEASTVDIQDANKNNVIIRADFDGGNVPRNGTPNVELENVTFEHSGWCVGAHPRVVEEVEVLVRGDREAIHEGRLVVLAHGTGLICISHVTSHSHARTCSHKTRRILRVSGSKRCECIISGNRQEWLFRTKLTSPLVVACVLTATALLDMTWVDVYRLVLTLGLFYSRSRIAAARAPLAPIRDPCCCGCCGCWCSFRRRSGPIRSTFER